MGQVYRAAHARIACTFAVKVVWGDFAYDQQMQSRFVREAEVASCLSSRHIVRVIDFAEENGSLPYLVMEFLQGPSLYDVIAKAGKLEPARAVRIAEQICRGLAHAHERGVVHRDLKPENIALVSEDDEPEVAKILDFGVARLRDGDRLTGFGTAVGTPLYMSPEQLTGAELDGRSDLYALGVVLFEMLTGHPPFQATSLPELTRKHLQDAPPMVHPDGSDLPTLGHAGVFAALNDLVQRLLAKNAAQRIATARDVVVALRAATSSDGPALTVRSPQINLPSEPPFLEETTAGLIQRAILAGAPRYNAGDHQGCFEIYRGLAHTILSKPVGAAIEARLRAALDRGSQRSNVTLSAWELRYAFDDLLSVPSIALRGEVLSDETSAFLAIASARRSDENRELLGDFLMAFAKALAARIGQTPRHAELAKSLNKAASDAQQKGGGARAIPIVEPLLDILKVGAVTTNGSTVPLSSLASRPPPSAPASAPNSGASPDIAERIRAAIAIGVPAFNAANHARCAQVYRDAAQMLADDKRAQPAMGALVRRLERALSVAVNQSPTDAAWTLRRAFDEILAGK